MLQIIIHCHHSASHAAGTPEYNIVYLCLFKYIIYNVYKIGVMDVIGPLRNEQFPFFLQKFSWSCRYRVQLYFIILCIQSIPGDFSF